MSSEAYNRFIRSMQIDYEKWREGTGYDLSALDDMSAEEKQSLARMLRGRDDWRDAEALAAIELDSALDAHESDGDAPGVREMTRSNDLPTRMKALESLHDAGRLSDAELETALLEALDLVKPYEGLTQCFFLLTRVPTDKVKHKLLWCMLNRREFGALFAGKLWQLCGKSEEEFDWDQRPMFLKFGNQVSDWDKHQALQTFCRETGLDPANAAASA